MSIIPAKGAFAEPDFAYPQTVSRDAEAALARAVTLGADSASLVRLRALEELAVAKTKVDPDSVYAIPDIISDYADCPNNTNAGRALLLALKASTLTNIYTSNRWDIDRVDAPLQPVPENIKLWSRDQYRLSTFALYDSALALAPDTPLSAYAPALSDNEVAMAYIPTVSAFVRSLAVANARVFDDAPRVAALTEAGLRATAATSPEHIYWLYASTQGNAAKRLAAYRQNENLEAARLLLDGLGDVEEEAEDGGDDDDALVSTSGLRTIAMLKQSLEAFPNWVGNVNLRNRLASMTHPRCRVSVPTLAAPGQNLKLNVQYAFANTVTLRVYRVPDNFRYETAEELESMPLYTSMEVSVSGKTGSSPLELTLAETGCYVFAAAVDGNAGHSSVAFTTVTPVLPFTLSCGGNNYAVTTNIHTGAPVGGVSVDRRVRNFRSGTSRDYRLGKTDGKGLLNFSVPSEARSTQSLIFGIDGHNFDFEGNFGVNGYEQGRPQKIRAAILMTDRALYHPGDSVRFAVVAYNREDTRGAVLAGKKLAVNFYDANGDSIDICEGRTDDLGRLVGSFKVPTGRLMGDYSLRVEYDDDNLCYSTITVSDFKLPTIHITDLSTARDEPSAGAVTLRGRLLTYSGVAVAGARIEAKISRARRWWNFFAPEEPLGTVEATTDAEGYYTIVASPELLDVSEDVSRNFSAAITATSLNAETAQATLNFTVGKPLVLVGQFPATFNASTSGGKAKIMAFNAAGEPQSVPVSWSLCKADGQTVYTGSATTGADFGLDLGAVPAGHYTVKAVTESAELADSTSLCELAVYNTATNDVPSSECPYFIPTGAVSRQKDKVKVLVGVNKPSATIYIAVKNGKKLLSIKPFTFRRGFHTAAMEVAETETDLKVEAVAVYNFNTYHDNYTVPQDAEPSLAITAESFRDRLVPGDRETWRLHIGKESVPAAGAGMIATMFNGALEALEPYGTPAPVGFRAPYVYLRVNSLSVRSILLSSSLPAHTENGYWSFEVPQWKYMASIPYAMYNGMLMAPRMYKSRAMATADYADSMEMEEAVELTGGVNDAGAVPEESAPQSQPAPQPDVQYRDGNVLQAFFMPHLMADADGNVDIEFTVPNANATWALRAFGWTGNMESASYAGEAIASKPVMVQPNLPRYLRQGDTARLGATVFNNTDSTATVTTTVEIFNTSTGAVLSTQTFVDCIAAGASVIVNVEAGAPTDVPSIGYRVKAVSGRYGDGEQNAIPVLPSAGTVVESTEFYLNPTQEPLVLDIPVADGTSYTLQYVSNPIWTVVKALRGISANGGTTSTAIVGRLFSTLAAGRIAAQCPGVAEAYRQWAEAPGDSALTSMLARNAELKTLLLEQTPWTQTATSQSDRMAELGRIFDRSAVAASQQRNTEALANLAGANGGIAWGSWANEPSEWATRNVLTTLGLANSMEMLSGNQEIIDIARKAYNYLQAQVTRPNRPETDPEFALISSFFPSFERTPEAEALLSRSVAKLATDWRRLDTVEKAYAVLILKANGKNNVASRIIASLSQYGVVRSGQGMCFPSVDDVRGYATIIQAFAAMGASRATIDAMRQWITVQAQATDDLGAYNPDYIIASVMLTGSDWTTAPLAFGLKVDGRELESSALERATGYTVERLTPSGTTLRIDVRPNGATPSYGSVTSVGRRTMATVEARAGRDVAIGKRFLVSRGGQWVATDSFALGERVRVQLIVEAGRDLEYVAITDSRAATLEPVDQLPGFVYDGSLGFYRENGDAETRLFLNWLPAGTYHITYDMTANNCGRFASGIATLQSQYAPELTAHSGGTTLTVKPQL